MTIAEDIAQIKWAWGKYQVIQGKLTANLEERVKLLEEANSLLEQLTEKTADVLGD
jgi:hypothetical protein